VTFFYPNIPKERFHELCPNGTDSNAKPGYVKVKAKMQIDVP
jgi:hypothetical protein